MFAIVGKTQHQCFETEYRIVEVPSVDDLSVPVFASPYTYTAIDPVLTCHL